MKYVIVFIFSCLVIEKSFPQTQLLKSEEIETPQEIINKLGDKVIKTSSIDFDGDLIRDYIVIVKTGLNEEPLTREYWFKSNFDLLKKVDLNIMDYDFKFFVNIDNDPEPEIFRAVGYSDGIDYFFTNQNLETGNESILFYFIPIIKKEGKEDHHWGYPWTLKSIYLKSNKEDIELNCSLYHEIIRDAEIHIPDDQSVFPIIMFDGTPQSKYDYSNKIESNQWLTIQKIIEQIK